MSEQKKFHKVATSLYRYGTQGGYYAYWKERGKLRRKKLKSKTVRDAKIEAGRLKEKYAKIDPAKRNETLLDAATKYLGTLGRLSRSTRTRAEGIVKKLGCSPLASRKISEIRRSDLETWLSQTTENLSNTTYNKHLGVLYQTFNLALADGTVFESPVEGMKALKPEDPERLTPTWEQAWRIIGEIRAQHPAHTADDSGNFVEFLLLSGIGKGEAASLRWKHINWSRGVLSVKRLKTEKRFEVPIFKCLRTFLESLSPGKPNDSVLAIHSARKAITNACKRLGYPAFTQRSFRRCFITRAVEAGIDFKTLAAWQGHQDGGFLISQTYSHLRNEHSQKMAERI